MRSRSVLSDQGLDAGRPIRARLEHRHALDLADDVELVTESRDGRLAVGFEVGRVARALAFVERV